MPLLEKLDMVGCDNLIKINVKLPKLTIANFSSCPKLNTIELDSPELLKLDLSNCASIDLEKSTFNCPKLEELKIRNKSLLEKPEDAFFKELQKTLLKKFPALKELDINSTRYKKHIFNHFKPAPPNSTSTDNTNTTNHNHHIKFGGWGSSGLL